ncbi:MAG: hypothetical protein WC755_03670 [Candidatus Woesearchaeota archaeon]|jgi:hypothetical protein
MTKKGVSKKKSKSVVVKKGNSLKVNDVDDYANLKQKLWKFIYWTPRILSIIFILFLVLFSLDVFEPGLTFWQIFVGLFMHNIPSLILLVALIISWKYEIIGAVAFNLVGILYIMWLFSNIYFDHFMILKAMIIAGPAFLIGILFLVGWNKKRK